MTDQEPVAHHEAPTQALGDFLRRRREQIAQRWADEALFRTVFTVSRDEAVEAAGPWWSTRRGGVLGADREPGSHRLRRRAGTARTHGGRALRAGASADQIADDVSALRPSITELLNADLSEAPDEDARELLITLTVLLGTLRLVVLETVLTAGEELIERQRLQLLEVATPRHQTVDRHRRRALIGTLDSAAARW